MCAQLLIQNGTMIRRTDLYRHTADKPFFHSISKKINENRKLLVLTDGLPSANTKARSFNELTSKLPSRAIQNLILYLNLQTSIALFL